MEESSKPMAPAESYPRSDAEAANEDPRELRRKKRIKYSLYFVAFVVFQTGIIVLFALTIMKIRTPKFTVRSGAVVQSLRLGTEANPSFNLLMNFHLSVKNTNFGSFKYENTLMSLYYRGSLAGEVNVFGASVGWRSTKKLNVNALVFSSDLPANSSLPEDLRAGVLPITTQSILNGKVKLVQVFPKKKSVQMNCSFNIDIKSQQVSNIACN